MQPIKVPISNDPVTGNARELVMTRLVFEKDLEASLSMEIHELNEQGVSLFEVAKTTPGLSEAQRNIAMSKHFPVQTPPYSTRDAKVNAFGQIDPEGQFSEIESLFSITIGQLKAMTGKSDNDSALAAVFDIVRQKMIDTNTRGKN
jgi:hypothetical protein